jgi:hypothetical protein
MAEEMCRICFGVLGSARADCATCRRVVHPPCAVYHLSRRKDNTGVQCNTCAAVTCVSCGRKPFLWDTKCEVCRYTTCSACIEECGSCGPLCGNVLCPNAALIHSAECNWCKKTGMCVDMMSVCDMCTIQHCSDCIRTCQFSGRELCVPCHDKVK